MVHTSTKSLGPYVFENIVDGVILLTGDGMIAYMNKSAQAMLSIDENQLDKSLPGIWLQQTDSRNDEFCQCILDALYNKQELISRSADFYNEEGKQRILNIKSSYWNAPDQDTQSGILLVLQDITAEQQLKKEKEDSILIFSLFLTTVGIWTLFYSALVNFNIQIPAFSMTYILLGLGLILSWAISRHTNLKVSDLGLSFQNIRRPLLLNIAISVSGCLLLIAAKALFVRMGFDYFPENQPFFDFHFSLGMKLYPLSVLLQEFLSQSVIHECLLRILKGKHSSILAIFLSAVLFTALHIHRGFGFMIGSLVLACVIGIMYRKQRTIWGICITHYSISMMAFFLNWV